MRIEKLHINALTRTLSVDLRRALWSSRFLLSVLLTLGWMVGNSLRELNGAKVVGGPYLASMAVDGTLYLGPVILAIAAIPYAGEYLAERKEGYERLAAQRVGIEAYGLSKVVTTVVSAVMMAFLAYGLFLIWIHILRLPQTISAGRDGTYLAWVYTCGTGWYYGAMMVRLGMVCGLASIFSLMVSACIPNTYVVFLAPVIGYYFLECIINILGKILPIPEVLYLFSPMGLCFAQIYMNPAVSYILTVNILVLGMILCGRCFLGLLRRGERYEASANRET